jgi:hypothetical protein
VAVVDPISDLDLKHRAKTKGLPGSGTSPSNWIPSDCDVTIPRSVANDFGGDEPVVSPLLRTIEFCVSNSKSAEVMLSNFFTSNTTAARNTCARKSSHGNGWVPGLKKLSNPTIASPGPAEKLESGGFASERHTPFDPFEPGPWF